MALDFWNNPIIVSAFRVKFRRGGLFNFTTIYLLVLVTLGVLIARYDDPMKFGPWPRNYLLALLGAQFVLSALVAGSATTASIRTEVINQTLDFQRIATLSPAQILIGKLLGEPALAYLLAIATIPLAVFCWTLGIAGVSLDVLLLLYVNLAAMTFLFGTIGLLQRVEPGGSRQAGSMGVAFGTAIILALMVLPPLIANARQILATPWSAAMVGLLTPVPAFFGVFTGDPWRPCLLFFGLKIPLILAAPVAQLVLAYLCFHIMVRRLINPTNPALSKWFAYVVLLVIDVLTAGVLLEPLPLGLPLATRCTAFCLVHLLAGLWLINCVTPWRECLHSWVWRFRGRTPRLWDWWLGERSENGLVLLTFCVEGLLSLFLFVLVPAGAQEGWTIVASRRPVILCAALTSSFLLLTLGTLHQWLAWIAGRAGKALLLTILALGILPPHLLGEYYQQDWLLALSPSAHFARWFGGQLLPHWEYLVGLYGIVLVASWLALRGRLAQLERVVDGKLQQMGVFPVATTPADE